MTGGEEYFQRIHEDVFRRACAEVRTRRAVAEAVWVFRYPRPDPLGSIVSVSLVERGTVAERLARMGAECAVYVHEQLTAGTGRLLVAVALWPRQALSAVRAASYGQDGRPPAEIGTAGTGLEDLDVPWLHACLPAGHAATAVNSAVPAPGPGRAVGAAVGIAWLRGYRRRLR
ncbi:hypothetical protein [Streptomyces sp. ISL-94]|uniref:hypothetical protein n=1 Tax=Streptomyces sp. ISL-94 TaxID=2819190 RepID=UPI001BE673C3|nr:hypothetical protein [Streptomyces sp. ISL-94]MBT2482813.1 hypothetical protein [Streptomyces sp. ISL-94]